ncbi:hypothetical protein LWI29_026306 [Acer saccharum]|uniref:Uncharacterized protein n=1 Tax=Acer saccharum TaxID=4024 RepID=A0AA39SKJ2_ACESA|nr:hypothetical protein LWI29_026306 [Acer saccharum]
MVTLHYSLPQQTTAVVCLFLDLTANGITTSSSFKSKELQNSVEQVNLLSTENNDDDPAEPNCLDRSGTVRTFGKEILKEDNEEDSSKHEDLNMDWSALEGVSRVNTLLTLPRFTAGKEDKKAAAARI